MAKKHVFMYEYGTVLLLSSDHRVVWRLTTVILACRAREKLGVRRGLGVPACASNGRAVSLLECQYLSIIALPEYEGTARLL